MDKVYVEFFRKLSANSDNLSAYVDSLYAGDEYSDEDLNHIFSILKKEQLISCQYADNKAWVHTITFEGKHYFDDEDKLRIVALIDRIDDIEKLFHPVGGNGVPIVGAIHDVQEFQDWYQEVHLELQDIYDRTNDHFIWETLNDFNKNMNGWTDKQIFSEIKGKLKAIHRNVGKYYPNTDVKKLEIKEVRQKPMQTKNPKIFISHSSKDVNYVAQIVNLLDGMGLDQTQVFCSSLPGYGIPIDSNIFDFLREQFLEYDLHVIFVHSDNYYKSAVSLNEMGAAWALRNAVTSVLLPGFEFEKMVGVVNNQSIAIKLDGQLLELQDKLNQLYDKVVSEFGITKKADIIWQQKRDTFIKEVLQMIPQKDDEQKLSEDAEGLLKTAAEDSTGQVLKTLDLSNSFSIQGGQTVMNNDSSQRENTRRITAIDIEKYLNSRNSL